MRSCPALPLEWSEGDFAAGRGGYQGGQGGASGQRDLFDTVDELQQAEQAQFGFGAQPTVQELRARHAWFDQALSLAQQEAAWHWELEFSSVFADRGGFDLQVGNPPWVRPRWEDDVILAEIDPWFGVTELKAETPQVRKRKSAALDSPEHQSMYAAEVARAAGLVANLGSAAIHPLLKGIQTNFYHLFMTLT